MPNSDPTCGRVLIAGTRSGSGKTTVTVAVIAALKARGLPVASFKCGPDYIDPMFHRAALGVPAHNLDPFFTDAQGLRDAVAAGARGRLGVIEGVMGYYDGIGPTTQASTFDVARATASPVVLVIDAQGMAASVGAVITGFSRFREPSLIRGVIVNRATTGTYDLVEPLIRDCGLVPLGFLPPQEAVAWPSRRLGLVTPGEIAWLAPAIARLAQMAAEHLDLDAIVHLAASAPELPLPAAAPPPSDLPSVTIAVARDEAFCFCYAETLELFTRLGATIVFFSPLRDARPPQADALYLPGGYPENHAAALAANQPMRQAIRQRIGQGWPVIAECGGFMYLLDCLDGHPMAGAIGGNAFLTPKLQRFGYVRLTAAGDSLLAAAGETLPAHEFHYYETTANGAAFTAVKAAGGAAYRCAHATPTMYAGFPHLYLAACPGAAERFIRAAAAARLGAAA